MVRFVLATALLALTACAGGDVSDQAIRRGISNDIEESHRPTSTDSRVVYPSLPPPIENGGYEPVNPSR